MSEAQLGDLARYAESPHFDAVEKLVLDLCVGMTRTPADVPEALFRSLERHFSPRALVELTTAIALENFRARFNRPFDVQAAGVSQGAVCPRNPPDG